jgi:hypothetical protein
VRGTGEVAFRPVREKAGSSSHLAANRAEEKSAIVGEDVQRSGCLCIVGRSVR